MDPDSGEEAEVQAMLWEPYRYPIKRFSGQAPSLRGAGMQNTDRDLSVDRRAGNTLGKPWTLWESFLTQMIEVLIADPHRSIL